jgi:hypothetical protein
MPDLIELWFNVFMLDAYVVRTHYIPLCTFVSHVTIRKYPLFLSTCSVLINVQSASVAEI